MFETKYIGADRYQLYDVVMNDLQFPTNNITCFGFFVKNDFLSIFLFRNISCIFRLVGSAVRYFY